MRWESAMSGNQPKFPSERVMADAYLGILIGAANALIAMGIVIAFVMM
jgi:hypothetical protein